MVGRHAGFYPTTDCQDHIFFYGGGGRGEEVSP